MTLAAVALVAGVLYIRNTHHMRDVRATTIAIAFAVVPVAAYFLAYWPLCFRFHRPFSVTELAEMNAFIWRYHVSCPGNPALDVHWYRWFFRATPERGLSYLMGNFVVVWLGFMALLVCAWRFCELCPSRRIGDAFLCCQPVAVGTDSAEASGLLLLFSACDVSWRGDYDCSVANALAAAVRCPPQLLLLTAAAVFFLYCYPRMAGLEAPYDCMFGCWS